MDPDVVAAIVADPRMTPAAVRVALHVGLMGEGEHAVKGVELAILVGGGEKPVRDALDRASHCGYLKVAFGGRAGHKLTFTAPEMTPYGAAFPENDSLGGVIYQNDSLRGGISEGASGNDSLQGGNSGNDSLGGVISAPIAVGEGDRREPPIIPLAALDDETEQAIDRHGEKLKGCRDSLRDYLRLYVHDPRKRYSFVQLVAGWLDGIDPNLWKLPDGTSLPPPERPPALALALNDLGASSRIMKGPEGDPANVRTKLMVHLRQRLEDDHGTNGRTAPRGGKGKADGGGSNTSDYDAFG